MAKLSSAEARRRPEQSRRDRIVKERERRDITGVSRVQWWRKEQLGEAPKRIRLGPKAIGWSEQELRSWVAERMAERV